MYLNKINNKQYLLDLLDDREKLNNVITQSRGYVLHLMEKNNIKPELNYLLSDDINIYSLEFIVKNYKLSESEGHHLKKYFKDDISANTIATNLSSQEIERYLIELKQLPKNTLIPFNLFSKYTKQIKQSQSLDYNSFVTDNIIKSIDNFSLSQCLSLGYDYFIENSYLFENDYLFLNFFGDDDFQKLYKDVILNRSNEDHGLPTLNLFKNYHFKSNDGDFLRELLNNEMNYSLKEYDSYSLNIVGFSELITNVEYFEKFNNRSLGGFSLEETVENKGLIQDVWCKNLNSWDDLINRDCTLVQFKEIIDNDFIGRIIKENPHHIRRSYGVQYDKLKGKSNHLKNVILEYIIDNFNTLHNIKKLNISVAIKEMFDSIENKYDDNHLYRENSKKFLNKYFVDLFKSQYFCDFIKDHNYNLINNNSLDFVNKAVLEKPSINLLYVIFAYVEINKDNENLLISVNVKKMKGIINDLISKLDNESVKVVANVFNYRLPISNRFNFNSGGVNNDFDFNFLNHQDIAIIDIPEKTQNLLLFVDKKFRIRVLDEGYFLENNILDSILNAFTNKEVLNFLIKYVDLHRDRLFENEDFVSKVLQSPVGGKILKINDTQINENNYNEFIKNIKIVNKLEGLRNLKQIEEKLLAIEDKNLLEVTRDLCSKFSNRVSWDFMDRKIDDLILKKDFEEIGLLRKSKLYFGHQKKFINYVNRLSYDNLLFNIDNKNFIVLLVGEIDYNQNTEIVFSKFSVRENIILAELLFPYFKDKTDVFALFNKDSLDFVNQCAVKDTPMNIFYSYNFIPNKGSSYSRSYVNKNFTPEEIFKAYKNIEKEGNFFYEVGANAGFSHFLASNFEDNESGFLKLVEIAKKSDYKLYVILAHNDIFTNFIESKVDDNKIPDQLRMEYFHSNFDIDILLSGMKIILDEIKNFGDSVDVIDGGGPVFNKKLAEETVNEVIYNTSYNKVAYTSGGRIDYYSCFTKEESIKIVDFLFQEAPLYLLGRNVVGCINNISEYVGKNIKNYIKEDVNIVEHLVYPLYATKPEYFSLTSYGGESSLSKCVEDVINSVVDHCSLVKDFTSLDYLTFLMHQKNFFEKEIVYDYKNLHLNKVYGGIIDYLCDDNAFIENLKIHQNHLLLENTLTINVNNKRIKNKI